MGPGLTKRGQVLLTAVAFVPGQPNNNSGNHQTGHVSLIEEQPENEEWDEEVKGARYDAYDGQHQRKAYERGQGNKQRAADELEPRGGWLPPPC